jgi:hypothetical protein
VLSWTAGSEVVAVAGGILLGVGLYQAYKGLAETFMDESDTTKMTPRVRRAFAALGIVGHLARTVVFGLTGTG